MRRGLWVQHVAGRQIDWVLITASDKCFKTASVWHKNKHHTFLLLNQPSCVSFNLVRLTPAPAVTVTLQVLPNLGGVLDEY